MYNSVVLNMQSLWLLKMDSLKTQSIWLFKSGHSFSTQISKYLKSDTNSVYPIHINKYRASVSVRYISNMAIAFALKCPYFITCSWKKKKRIQKSGNHSAMSIWWHANYFRLQARMKKKKKKTYFACYKYFHS